MQHIIVTYAGTGILGSTGDDSMARSARLMLSTFAPYSGKPSGIAVDSSGKVYLVDKDKVRVISSAGIITTFAGMSQSGWSGDNGPATSAQLSGPWGVAVGISGNIYITDYYNNRVRMVSNTGTITTFAGGGGGGDNGPAVGAQMLNPTGIAADISGNVYFIDNMYTVRLVSNGIITTFAGGSGIDGGDNGPAISAGLSFPHAVAADIHGNVYICDTGNNKIRKVSSNGIITTIAGTGVWGTSGDGGAATSAELYYLRGVAVDSRGNVFIADDNRVRLLTSAGIITTFAGTEEGGSDSDGIPATSAQVDARGVAVGNDGNVYVADYYSHKIWLVVQTQQPSPLPSSQPSKQPSAQPSSLLQKGSSLPTGQPSRRPTGFHLHPDARYPTAQPSRLPSRQPSRQPTAHPSSFLQKFSVPTGQPTNRPTSFNINPKAGIPTSQPTRNPSSRPTTRLQKGSSLPTGQPSRRPTGFHLHPDARYPTAQPSRLPSRQPSRQPTGQPSKVTLQQHSQPTGQPTRLPSRPTGQPTARPSRPTSQPSLQPTRRQSARPSRPTSQPSSRPSGPTLHPSMQPTAQPSARPSQPSGQPTRLPSRPTGQPSSLPSKLQTSVRPTPNAGIPTGQPTRQPTGQPSKVTLQKISQPTSQPSSIPSKPSRLPSYRPTPYAARMDPPTGQPTRQPTVNPSAAFLQVNKSVVFLHLESMIDDASTHFHRCLFVCLLQAYESVVYMSYVIAH